MGRAPASAVQLIFRNYRDTHRRNLDASSPAAERALGRYLLFSDGDARRRAGFETLSEVDAFYNSYYWFLVFAKLYQESAGYDAGIEQQSFRILEQIPQEGDWKIVEKIAEAAK